MKDDEKIKKLEEELSILRQQILEQEKLAAIGKLTAGIMHEIQNPLNFINNFSHLSTELIKEIKEVIEENQEKLNKDANEELEELMQTTSSNLQKIKESGKRASSIISNILLQSRGKAGILIPTDFNKLIIEYMNLAYHGKRAEDQQFNCSLKSNMDESIGKINIVPQDFSRVIFNLLNNSFYAVNEKQRNEGEGYSPEVIVSTKKETNRIITSIRDNGTGIPTETLQNIFTPFYSTKPIGKGTGLGLSMSIDIIKGEHKGDLLVKSELGKFTEFIIEIPGNLEA